MKLSFSLMSCPGSKIWQWVVTRVRFNIFWLFSRQFATATASQCSSDFPELQYLNRYTSTSNQWLKPQRLTFQPRNLTIPTQKLYHSYPEALPFLPRSFNIPTQKLYHSYPETLPFLPRNFNIPTRKLRHSYPENLTFLTRNFNIPTQKL